MSNESLQADVNYFRSLPAHKAGDELDGCDKQYLSKLAKHIGIDLRFSTGELKSRDVLAAAVYEYVVFDQKI